LISNEIPCSALTLGVANGCHNARQPLYGRGNDFSKQSMVIAESDTLEVIACLSTENNNAESPNLGRA
jgi:hypothetical protein